MSVSDCRVADGRETGVRVRLVSGPVAVRPRPNRTRARRFTSPRSAADGRSTSGDVTNTDRRRLHASGGDLADTDACDDDPGMPNVSDLGV